MSGPIPFIIRRILVSIPVLLFVTAGTFFLGRFAPGDPITVRTGGHASPEQVQRIRQQLGLNDPIPVQYEHYMLALTHGDLGTSLRHPGVPISELIFPKLLVSTQLLILPTMLIFAVGIPVGVLAARKQGRWQDPAIIGSLIFIAAIPEIIIIPLLQVLFAVKLKWLPVGGWDGMFSPRIILPTLVLTVPALGGIANLMRNSLLQVMGEDWVRTARAKGLQERIVLMRHAARNAMLPIISGVVYAIVFIFSGDLFVETLFGIPGFAREAVQSIGSRDYDEFMAIVIIGAIALILANLILDIVYGIVDPRISLSGDSK
jgi:ABC-type dipeptide/oligopeptide/nickel transport system permease component